MSCIVGLCVGGGEEVVCCVVRLCEGGGEGEMKGVNWVMGTLSVLSLPIFLSSFSNFRSIIFPTAWVRVRFIPFLLSTSITVSFFSVPSIALVDVSMFCSPLSSLGEWVSLLICTEP